MWKCIENLSKEKVLDFLNENNLEPEDVKIILLKKSFNIPDYEIFYRQGDDEVE